MTKLSGLNTNAAPALGDFAIKVKAGGGGDVGVTWQNVLISLLQKTRLAQMQLYADNTGGTNFTQQEANDVTFTSNTSYLRASVQVPADYVPGTSANLLLYMYAPSSNNTTFTYYVGAHYVGQVISTWNVASNVTSGSGIGLTTSNQLYSIPVATVPAGNLSAGGYVNLAFRLTNVPTGSVYATQALFQYTAAV